MTRPAIEAIGLEKRFVKPRSIREIARHPFARAERVDALRGVDLSIAPGETLTLLGPNGAGKTTLLKILSCLVLPDRGRALVGGVETIDENRVKRQIGLVHSDERSFYWRLSARENLRFFARLYDVPSARIETRVQELLERVDLAAAADRPFSGYSSGMKQRVAFARALLHDPPILLMDEPTRSLDPATALSLRRFVREELSLRDGKTIVIATHDLREAEALATRIAILVRGRVRQIGSAGELRRWGVRERRWRLALLASEAAVGAPFRVIDDARADGRRLVTVALDAEARLHDGLRALIAAGHTIVDCHAVEPDLEEAFTRIVAAEDGSAA